MKVGLIGYGKMGRAIFSLLERAPFEVAVLDVDGDEMARQNRRLEKRLLRAANGGTLSEADARRRLAELHFTTCWDDLQGSDLVIETVFESYETKLDVLRRAEEIVSPEAIISSNTSSLSITRLGQALENPGRFSGFHFFHPVQLTTIVEIITSPQTAPATVDYLREVSGQIGRRPLVVKDEGGGSCINVLLTCQTCEALYMLEQRLALPSRIDRLCAQFSRIGPCEGLDVVGIPFFTEVLGRTLESFPLGLVVPDLCHKLVRDGRLGKYVNQGLYLYKDDRPVDDSPDYYANPNQTHTPNNVRSDDAGLAERLLFPVYFTILKMRQMGLAELGDLCLGIRDLIGLTADPLDDMRKLGADGLRAAFNRLRDELGARYDCAPLEGAMAELDSMASPAS